MEVRLRFRLNPIVVSSILTPSQRESHVSFLIDNQSVGHQNGGQVYPRTTPIEKNETGAMASWGDTASLRAALSVVDDWETEFGALFSLDTPEMKTDSLKLPPRQRNKETTASLGTPYSRQRKDPRKLEILELRAEVEELQQALEREKASKSAGCPPTKEEEVSADEAMIQQVWEHMSERQGHERFASEIENAKLKKMMESQTKAAQKIVQLTQRLAHLQRSLPPSLVSATVSGDYRGPDVDLSEQRAYLQCLKSKASEVFLAESFVKLRGLQCFRQVQYRDPHPSVDGIEVESEVAWMLPFPAEAVANALWDQARRLAAREKTYEQWNLFEDAETLVVRFIGHGAMDTSHGQIATLRCAPSCENGSILLVSNARGCFFIDAECKGFVNSDGWLHVEQIEGTPASAPLTRFNWCRRSRIRPPNYDAMTPAERTEWVGTVISGSMKSRLEKALDWNVQAIENALLAPRPTAVGS